MNIASIALLIVGYCLFNIVYRAYGARDWLLFTEALLVYIAVIVYIIFRGEVR